MSKSTSYLLKSDEWKIPVQVVREWRPSIRFSIGKKGAYLRFPRHLDSSQMTREIERANLWIKSQLVANPNLAAHFYQKDYSNGQSLTVGLHTYQIAIQEKDCAAYSAKLRNDLTIQIGIPFGATSEHLANTIPVLLSRVIGRHQLSRIQSRVYELNDLHFQRPIGTIRMKYNRSNWGSCSHTGNINLSTRLLFAPPTVQDYVIIHELSHLIEMNHSKAFYALISKVMPNYKEYEKWLKENSHLCHF